MPPKKQSGPSKKTVEKKKDKVIEDKTFGLKNKKGKKQQQFVKQVTNQVKYGGGTSIQKREELERKEKQKKEDEKKQKAEMESLLRPAQPMQKVSAGADPKSVLCLFFKQGQCKKGDKCKFSHDLTMEGKSEKRSMYVDKRDLEEDTIDKWDESKLKEVVQKKHGGKTKQKTDIVCKHFLHAIEKGIYGWFWECPNGDRCIYRHALPPGFVFKKIGAQTNEAEEDTITIEQLVENERHQLAMSGRTLTPVTLDSFKAWKERKLKEKDDKIKASAAKKKEAFVAGRTHGISGREMFEFNPDLVQGDDQEAGDDAGVYKREREAREGDEDGAGEEGREREEEEVARDITDMVGYMDEVIPLPPPPAASGTGTTTADSSHQTQEAASASEGGAVGGASNCITGGGVGENEEEEEEEEEEEIPIDEDLFAAEELENLDLEDIEDIEPSAVD